MNEQNRDEADKGEYEFPLAIFMDTMLQRWGEDRETFWRKEGGPFDIDNAKEIDDDIFELASKIYDTSKNPISSDAMMRAFRKIDLNKFPKRKGDIFKSDFWTYLWERLEEYLADDSIKKWEDAASNMLGFFFLFLIHKNAELSKPVSLFMKLVIRNYVWGFNPECVILCRSAMESAFRESINQETLEKYGTMRNASFKDYISCAKEEGYLSEDLANIANTIRLRGNKALHYDPESTKDVTGTIALTLRVISALANKL